MSETLEAIQPVEAAEAAEHAYLTEAQLKIAKIASKDATRFATNCIRVNETEVVVTDGYILMVVTHRQPIAGLIPFNLTAENALRVAKTAAKGKNEKGPYAGVSKVDIDLQKTQSNGDLRTRGSATIEVPKNTEEYPDYDRLMPKDEPTFSVGVNGKLLADLLNQVVQFAGDRDMVEIHFRDGKDSSGNQCRSIELKTGKPGGEQVRALISPMRIK